MAPPMKLKQIVWIWPGTSLLALILLIGLCLPTWGAGTCTNFVSDGSFEMEVDPYVPAWRQYSDNFGSPLCNSETCGGSYARPPGAWPPVRWPAPVATLPALPARLAPDERVPGAMSG